MRRLGLRWVITLGLIAVALLMMADSARAATCAIYTGDAPATVSAFTGNVGTRFTVQGDGASVTAARWYRHEDEAGASHNVRLWTDSGSLLATKEDTSTQGGSAWKTVTFDSPVALSDGETYVIAVELFGYVAYSTDPTGSADCGPVTRETTTSGSTYFGRYTTGTGASRPNAATSQNHYFVDPTIDYDTEPPPPEEGEEATDAQLTWWGIWAIVGLLFVLMIAPLFLRLLDVRQGMGGRFERG